MFKILVVEDDIQLNQLFCKTLKRNGYETYSASDAMRAFKILEAEMIDMIISDVMMPEIDGFEFLQQLREAQMITW